MSSSSPPAGASGPCGLRVCLCVCIVRFTLNHAVIRLYRPLQFSRRPSSLDQTDPPPTRLGNDCFSPLSLRPLGSLCYVSFPFALDSKSLSILPVLASRVQAGWLPHSGLTHRLDAAGNTSARPLAPSLLTPLFPSSLPSPHPVSTPGDSAICSGLVWYFLAVVPRSPPSRPGPRESAMPPTFPLLILS